MALSCNVCGFGTVHTKDFIMACDTCGSEKVMVTAVRTPQHRLCRGCDHVIHVSEGDWCVTCMETK